MSFILGLVTLIFTGSIMTATEEKAPAVYYTVGIAYTIFASFAIGEFIVGLLK